MAVLLDLALADDANIAKEAAAVLKTQVFLYDADTARLEAAYKAGSAIAEDILKSYADAEFFTSLPEIEEEIKVVTYVAAEGDISTDLMSPGAEAHSRADRELHGKTSQFGRNRLLLPQLYWRQNRLLSVLLGA